MFYSLSCICILLINTISTENTSCSSLNKKLNPYGISINTQEKHSIGLRLCQGLINDHCCLQIYEDKIQNISTIELYHLFELYSIHLYQSLVRLTGELNETILKLIESSRNETHLVFQRDYKIFYRTSIDLFYNNLFTIISRNSYQDIKSNMEELFRNLLRISIVSNNEKCLWQNHPFGNRPNLIVNQLEINLKKIFYLKELFKLSIELVQIISTSVTTDYHCIDSYMQLSYCNLCSGRDELPCLANCINIIESCLGNVSLINDVWINFIDSIENVVYFNSIEKDLSTIGIFISDALITFFNSDEIHNKDIINQCGHINIRKDIFDNNQKFYQGYRNSLSLVDTQLMSMRQSLDIYRRFWVMLPKQICESNGFSALKEKACWTGSSISQDGRQSIQTNYDKPLNLRLQWILKEMKEKSQIIGNIQLKNTVMNISATTTNSLILNRLKVNSTDDLDDYSVDNEFDYSDYVYEDSIDESTTRSTTLQSSSISIYDDDDILIDELNTISYYDYGEQDEIDDTSTEQLFLTIKTTTPVIRIPSYHQRRPIIWNINTNNNDFNHQSNQQYNNSSSLTYSLLLFLFLNVLLT